MMFVLGLGIGLGIYMLFNGLYEIVGKRVAYMHSLIVKLHSDDFGLQLNLSLITSIAATFVFGIVFKEIVVLATICGFLLGWLIAHVQRAKRDRENLLHVSLATATLAEDCAILSTTHLGIRQSLALALASSSPVVQERIKNTMDLASENVLFVNQLKELSQVEKENSLGRFARTLSLSLERGNSPELSLLQLAREVRETSRRELMQLAAKKEIAMMVPVVFAVLPSVTAVALFPAMKSLQHL